MDYYIPMPQKQYEWELGDGLPEIGAHSLAKHRILRRYIERYIEIVTAISRQEQLSITFVDGYAKTSLPKRSSDDPSGLIHSDDSQIGRSSPSSHYESRNCRQRHATRSPPA